LCRRRPWGCLVAPPLRGRAPITSGTPRILGLCALLAVAPRILELCAVVLCILELRAVALLIITHTLFGSCWQRWQRGEHSSETVYPVHTESSHGLIDCVLLLFIHAPSIAQAPPLHQTAAPQGKRNLIIFPFGYLTTGYLCGIIMPVSSAL